MLPEKRWLTVSETAELYALHPGTVFKLCKMNRIPHTRIPSVRRKGRGQIRVDRRLLDELLESQENQVKTLAGT